MRVRISLVMGWAMAIVCLAGPVFGQGLEPGEFEVSGRAGISGGLSDLAGLDVLSGQGFDPGTIPPGLSNTEWHVGGGVATGLSENTHVRFDITRTSLFSTRVDLPTPGEFVEVGLNLIEFTGGIEYLLGDGDIVPFVGAGGGLARIGAGIGLNAGGPALDVGLADYGGTYNLGAGARAPITDRLGLRPEIQFVHISGENFWRASFGFFYGLN
jgi:hypothetical protein